MRRPIRVLHVISGLGTGGAEAMLHKLLEALPRDRFDSRVISLGGAGVFGPRLEGMGIPVRCLSLQSPRQGLRALWRLLADEPEGWKADVLQGWMYHGNLACQLGSALGLHRGPVLWNIRHSLGGLSQPKALTRIIIRLGGFLCRQPSRVVCNSKAAIRTHLGHGYGPAAWALIPNGFDLERFRPDTGAGDRVRKQLGIATDTFLVGMVARLHPVKGHRVLLEAAAQVRAQRPDVHFLLVGRGAEAGGGAFEALRHDLGSKEGVHALGERMDDLPELTAALDVAVSASLSEAFSNTLGEAMACAVPCVATDVGDSAWIVGEGGLVVPPDDVPALAAAVLRIASLDVDSRRSMGTLARARVSGCFSLATVAGQYEKLYEEVLASD